MNPAHEPVRPCHPVCLLLTAVLAASVGLLACSSSSRSAYFVVGDNNSISLTNNALGKDFLLMVDVTPQEGIQDFNALKSRIVQFQLDGDRVLMLDTTGGQSVETAIPSTLVLAEFPFTWTSGMMKLDFEQGMSAVFADEAIFASDISGFEYLSTDAAVRPLTSFLQSVFVGTTGDLQARLLAQVEIDQDSSLYAPTNAYIFHFIPYSANPSFTPTLSPGQYQLGFFETFPLYGEHGETVVNAVKFDKMKAPITFAISANTPEEYRQAVQDGVLYWNLVLGEQLLAVTDAPSGVAAPDPNYNLVQWLDFETAGSAYASFKGDPRTGETLQANVYLPSVFAISGLKLVWEYLKMFETQDASSSSRAATSFTLRGFSRDFVCDFDARANATKLAAMLLVAQASNEQCLAASQDFVRLIVAHEVGHTLGLRHNFAGSLGINYQGQDRHALLKSYLADGNFPAEYVPTNSIMDYGDTIDELFAGAQIRNQVHNNIYDESALKFLYAGGTSDDIPVFCTDTDADAFLDCMRFDYGKSPVAHGMERLLSGLDPNYIAGSTMQKIMLAKIPRAGLIPTPIAKVFLNHATTAQGILGARQELLRVFTWDGLYARSFKRDFPGLTLSEIDQSYVRNSTIPDVLADFADYLADNQHGFTTPGDLFFTISSDIIVSLQASMDRLLVDPNWTSAVGADGTLYPLSPSEIEDARAVSSAYFTQLYEEMVNGDVAALASGSYDIVDGDLGDALVAVLSRATRTYLLDAVAGKTISATVNSVEPVTPMSIELPVFSHTYVLRSQVTGLLSSGRVSTPASLLWGRAQATADFAAFTAALDAVFSATGKSFDEAQTDMTDGALNSAEAIEWYLENQSLKNGYAARW